MERKYAESSPADYIAYVGGWSFPVLLLSSFKENWYVLSFISIAIGIALLIKYRPYLRNWFTNWMDEPRRSMTMGLMTGILVGSMLLLPNYKYQGYLPTAIGVVELAIGVILCAAFFMSYYKWPKRKYESRGGL